MSFRIEFRQQKFLLMIINRIRMNSLLIYFACVGASILLSWNAILSTLDFYQHKFSQAAPSFTYPAAFSTTMVIIMTLIIWIKKVMFINSRTSLCLIVQAILLVSLPIISTTLSNTKFGYWLTVVVVVTIGAIKQISNSSVIGLAGYFRPKFMSHLITGTGVGGVSVNVLRAFTLLLLLNSTNQTTNAEIFLYYRRSAAFLALCGFLHLRFIKSEFAIQEINKHTRGDSFGINRNSLSLEEILGTKRRPLTKNE